MNVLIFAGHLADTPELKEEGGTVLTRFRVIKSEFIGRHLEGQPRRKRQVSIQFTAFGKRAEELANRKPGDQLTVYATISNNNVTDGHGVDRDGHNFEVALIEPGIPPIDTTEFVDARR